MLARHFLRRFGTTHGKDGLTFTPAALRAIVRHTWPGNVRELQNRVLRAVIMCDRRQVDVEDLELKGDPESAPLVTLKEAREDIERQLVTDALRRHNGKIAPTAVELGVSRPTLYELLKKLKLEISR
jgi:two-component system NtrC family response regulator